MRIVTRNLNDVKHKNLSKDFYIKGQKSFTNQYAPLYAERLTSMRDELRSAAVAKWSTMFPKVEIKNLVDLVQNEKCIIIGTLYKEMKNKPNILRLTRLAFLYFIKTSQLKLFSNFLKRISR